MNSHTSRFVHCILLTLISTLFFFADAQENKDWKLIARKVTIVNYDKGESRAGDLFQNVINGKYVILPDPEKNETMYYVEYSDNPQYRYMFVYGDVYFGKKWYFNVKMDLQLPIENDLAFVRLIKAYCGARSGYFRLFRSVVDNSLTVVGDDPFFGYIVSKAEDSLYKYMFRMSGLYWYFD